MAATAAIAAGIRNRERAEREAEGLSPAGTPRNGAPAPAKPRKPKAPKTKPLLPKQKEIYEWYTSQRVQIFVAVLIVVNFIFSCAEKEVDPYPLELQLYPDVWKYGALVFNVIFFFELCCNFYGGVWWKSWWKSGWNVFDFLVVTLGTISILEVAANKDLLPSSLKLLRPFRAFRVFRLFKRVPSLNKIMVSLGKAIPGVANAFLIMVIIMCIYAILAVEFFSQFGKEGAYTTLQDHVNRNVTAEWAMQCDANGDNCELYENATVSAMTARGFTFGEEYYGTFMRALYTLFQVMTGESWSEAVARPTLLGDSAVVTGIFYVTFILVTQIVMVNVVVAVLLEKMVDDGEPTAAEEEEDDDVPEKSSGSSAGGSGGAAPSASVRDSVDLPKPTSVSQPKGTGSPVPGAASSVAPAMQRGASGDDDDNSDAELRYVDDSTPGLRGLIMRATSPGGKLRKSQIDEMQAQIAMMGMQLNAICEHLSLPVPDGNGKGGKGSSKQKKKRHKQKAEWPDGNNGAAARGASPVIQFDTNAGSGGPDLLRA